MVLRSEILVNKSDLPTAQQALPGRETPMAVPSEHYVHGHSLTDFPAGLQRAIFGFGCFWGAERRLWSEPGVWTTAAGYAGGFTPNPTYEEACSGLTGHSEVVLVLFDPAVTSYAKLLSIFWESHNPTQGMRQGNDIGTQYRSVIFCSDEAQLQAAQASEKLFQQQLTNAGMGEITTEIAMAPAFYYAEAYHQQYLAKNPAGYCGLGGTGVCMPPA